MLLFGENFLGGEFSKAEGGEGGGTLILSTICGINNNNKNDDYDEIVDEARRMVNEISLVVDWRGHLIWEVLFFGYCMVGMLMIAFGRGNSCGGLFLILYIELCWNISLATGA